MKEAEEYLIKLAEVYRYILQSNTKNDVAISEELSMIESYCFMLKKRFPNAIEMSIRLSKKCYAILSATFDFSVAFRKQCKTQCRK